MICSDLFWLRISLSEAFKSEILPVDFIFKGLAFFRGLLRDDTL